MSCELEKVVADVEYSGVTKFASKFVYNTSTSPACALVPGECSIGTELRCSTWAGGLGKKKGGKDEMSPLGLDRHGFARCAERSLKIYGLSWC